MADKSRNQHEEQDKQQIAKFRKAARELGCDEYEAHFEEKLKQVARHKPEKTASRPQRKAGTKQRQD